MKRRRPHLYRITVERIRVQETVIEVPGLNREQAIERAKVQALGCPEALAWLAAKGATIRIGKVSKLRQARAPAPLFDGERHAP